MAVFFGLPDQDAIDLLQTAMKSWHPDLAAHGVRVQLLFATSDTDAPAVRHGGYPAVATIRVVPLKDRLTKGYDAEMLVARDEWDLFGEAHKVALLDHELSHLEVCRKKVKMPKTHKGEPQFRVALDDLGRPKLKLRKGDWNPGDGFEAVVARHCDHADEFAALARAYAVANRAKEKGEAA